MAAAAAVACRRAVSYTLRGPPAESLRAAAARVAAGAPTTGDAFVELMDANFNKPIMPPPAKTLTENSSPTRSPRCAWRATSAACAARASPTARGSTPRRCGCTGATPTTLALNARPVAEFGYLKDFPEILHRIIHGGVSTRTPGKKARLAASGGVRVRSRGGRGDYGRHQGSSKRRGKARRAERRARVAAANERDQRISAEAALLRRKRRAEAAARAVDRYTRDPTYRLLHDRTADLFADLLAEDMKKLEQGRVNELSLAAKWCPSLESCYDRSTLLCEAIARCLFPKGSLPELPEDLEDEFYAYRARDLLRKTLVRQRRALELPEIFMTARAWGDVVYKRVASVAMQNYKDFFAEYDADRFQRYLADVESGKEKIAAGAVLPHEIVNAVLEDNDKVASLQWERMVADMRALGKLSNCIPICDVSGSMYGTPLDVSVALGLLVSELSDEPWRHRLITFSEHPQLHVIKGETLYEKAEFIRDMEDWCMNTDFQAVFDKLLRVAVAANLPPEKMVKRVIVFSDMEFDEASSNPWETDYEAITRKYTEAGYGDAVPEIVFWNLRASKSVPVTAHQKGVALVSGFSKNLVKIFLDGDGIVSPRTIMDKAISGKEYEKLVVFD
ncbi:hypothetical protein PR202_gb28069 [Eleusine coracana subsp. coracana]|uniref:Uncharacterized protein n=1 Tax=Eleusine coracana subsp. coracana TaxID=191504 RepID=A0AAV5FVG3_ELECO|nr:hypothetical protein PR202_gb28069 [Eleusine coracana subsp. coracana]